MSGSQWRRHLRLLQIGSIVLPVLVFAAWGVRVWDAHHQDAVATAESRVELVRQYALRVLQSQQSLLLEVGELLHDTDLDQSDLGEVHARLARLTQRFDFTLTLGVVSPTGKLVVSSQSHPVEVQVEDREYFNVLRKGEAVWHLERVVNLRPGGQEALILAKRRPGETFSGVIAAAVDIEAFTDFFGRIAAEERAAASLLRGDGMLLVRHTSDAPAIMLPPEAPALQAIARGERGTYEALAISDNIARIYAFARVGELPLYANFGWPKGAILDAWLGDMTAIGLLLGLAAILAFVGTAQAGKRFEAERARQQSEFDRRLLEETEKTAHLRETLLREVHHRTRNNLQAIQSLIRLRSRQTDARAAFADIDQRIWAIAHVHELLYVSQELSHLDLSEYLQAVCANPSIVPPERSIEVVCDLEAVEVDSNAAVPLALIAVELVTNAVKHAFPGNRRGRIEVSLGARGDRAELVVRDDGIGLPEVDRRASGTSLVHGLARQIDGRAEYLSNGGTTCRIDFPLAAAPPPVAGPPPGQRQLDPLAPA